MPGQFGWCKHSQKHVNLCKHKQKEHNFHTAFINLKILFSQSIYSYFTRGVKLASEPTTRFRVSLTYMPASIHIQIYVYKNTYIYAHVALIYKNFFFLEEPAKQLNRTKTHISELFSIKINKEKETKLSLLHFPPLKFTYLLCKILQYIKVLK